MSIESPRQHSDTPSALPIGTRLGEFELLSLLGVGGFGIVYLAFDHALEREVAVKEYMPASLAGRTQTLHVSLRSQSDAETFALGLKSFVNEARLLARFDHPSLLKVLRFWEGNGTAYMAMPVMRGNTLKEIRQGMNVSPDEGWTRALLEPLLGAIERLHSEGVYHRDIAPDNIQIEPDGRPVLLDFGAARRVISDKSQTLTAILKPAYAPIEQYAEVGSVKQGPWTDIYALGATLHFLLLARPPAPATARAVHDEASALTPQALPGYSQNFLHIVDWMLAPRPADRPQNVAMLRDALDGRIEPPHRRSAETPSHWDRTVAMPPTRATGRAADPGDDQATLVMPQTGAPGARPLPLPLPLPPAFGSAGVTGAVTGSLTGAGSQAGRTGLAAGARTAAFAAPATGFDPDFDRSPGPPPDAPTAAHTAAATAAATVASHNTAAAASATSATAPARSKLIPVLAGVAVIAVAALAAVLWPRQPTAPSVVAADPAPLATPSAALNNGTTAPPPASLVPESTVATVVLPRTPGAVPAQPGGATVSPTAPGAVANSKLPAQTPGARPANERLAGGTGARATGANSAAGATAPVAVAATALAASPSPAVASAPLQQAAPAGAGTATPAPEPAKPAVTAAAGPEATCGVKNPLSYFVCMERTCLKSEFSNHSDCQKWHKDARAARRE